MTATVKPKRMNGHSARGLTIAENFGIATGRTTGSAEQRLVGNDRLDRDNVELLKILRERGETVRMHDHLAPQLAIVNDVEPEPLTLEMLLAKAGADAKEDAGLAQFQADSCDGLTLEEVTRYRKEVGGEFQWVSKLYDALVLKENELRAERVREARSPR